MSDKPGEQSAPSALEPTLAAKIKRQINEGAIDFKGVVDALSPPPAEPEGVLPEYPRHELTADQRLALGRVNHVYGSVVLDERRTLTPEEFLDLYDERQTLDTVEKMASARKQEVRTYLLVHHDVEVEESADGEDIPLPREKDGHYVPPATVRYPIPGTDQTWSLEPREGSANLAPDKLKALADDESVSEFTHKDYLAVTEQVRVFDEHKAMLHLKKRPELLEVLARAVESRDKPSITVTNRKRK